MKIKKKFLEHFVIQHVHLHIKKEMNKRTFVFKSTRLLCTQKGTRN